MAEENVITGPELREPIPDKSLGMCLFDSLSDNSHENPVFIDAASGTRVSRNEFLRKTCLLADCLANCGYGQKDCISICSENSIYFYEPVVAALYLGICVVPINQNYNKDELLHILNMIKPKVIFCSKKSMYKFVDMLELSYIKNIIVFDLNEENVYGVEDYENFLKNNYSKSFNMASFRPIDVTINIKEHLALIMSSSGTTGLPKAVMITHRNIHYRFKHITDDRFFKQVKNAVYLCVIPFFHIFGFLTALENINQRNTIVVMDRFKEEKFLDAIQRYKVTNIYVVPTILVYLSKSSILAEYNLTSIQVILCGSAPLSKAVEDKISKIFNLNGVLQGYGLTESTMAVTVIPFHCPKLGSCGKVLPGIAIKIVDCLTGENLGATHVGEFCIKGGMIMKGYFGNLEATRNTIKEDWLFTGDLGYYDEEGYIYIVDRLKELIKYKGFQVAPAELEAILLSNPKIKDAAVIGIPDEEAGELPCAFVVKQNGIELSEIDVKNFVANRISRIKHLHGGVRFIEEIPKNASGKILRRVLREQVSKLETKPADNQNKVLS